MKGKKLTYDYVKNEIIKMGYTLLSENYNGCSSKLKLKCDNDHIYETTWSNLKSGSKCSICYRINQPQIMKKDFNEIKKVIETNDYILLSCSNEYKNNYSKLKCICNKGHNIEITWAEFKRGRRCIICSGFAKKTIDEIKEYMKKYNYTCLDDEYINGSSHLNIQCEKNHLYKSTWYNFKQGGRCPKCNLIKQSIERTGSKCIFWRGGISKEPYCQNWVLELKEYIKERDKYKCLNPCCNSGKKLTIHHIDYNKKNCSHKNLITICQSCNSKANFDRKWHKSWYEAILNKRYNYLY